MRYIVVIHSLLYFIEYTLNSIQLDTTYCSQLAIHPKLQLVGNVSSTVFHLKIHPIRYLVGNTSFTMLYIIYGVTVGW